jgi:Na+/H+ antiporter NhaC
MTLLIALIPAMVMITMVIATRKVLLSLGVGVVLAALIHESFHLINTVVYLFNALGNILTSFDWYLPILGFVVIIGGITSVLALIGGIRAFASWTVNKVKSPVAAEMMTWILGVVICIDDYFNALVIGEVTKPVTDEYRVSRAKLAYIIDSTSAPVVIMMPLSTWGAYIIGIMGGLFADNSYTVHSGFSGFVAAVPYQFYPITALLVVLLSIHFGINLLSMKTFELDAKAGDDTSKMKEDVSTQETVIEGTHASHWTLIVPMIVLVSVTLFLMLVFAGFEISEFMNQDITLPLFFGGLSAFICAIGFGLLYKKVPKGALFKAAGSGMFSMIKSATVILILAWMVSGAIQDLEVGELLADFINSINLATWLLPMIMFIIAGLIAFATGTSWGAFGILLPIAIPIVVATDVSIMPVIIASVLGGAVFGDHASPVSDTTVLSATGAQSTLHAHFISQLPYVFTSAVIAAVAYLLQGITETLVIPYLFIAGALIVFVQLKKTKTIKDTDNI